MSTEIPAYQVAFKEGPVEIRDYPALVVAEVTVPGDRTTAIRSGFRLLAGYIFGANDGGAKIAMTAPVVQSPGTKIAMTAPVTQTADGENWTVQFTMPSSFTMDSLPRPSNPAVKLRRVDPIRMAAIRFSGLGREPDIQRQTDLLNAFIASHHLTPAGAPSLARYDPPWTLWFMRRNEILIELQPSETPF